MRKILGFNFFLLNLIRVINLYACNSISQLQGFSFSFKTLQVMFGSRKILRKRKNIKNNNHKFDYLIKDLKKIKYK